MWMDSTGNSIENDTLMNVTVSRPSPLVVILTFAPLRTSHGGGYWCVANVNVEEHISLEDYSEFNITVQSKYLEFDRKVAVHDVKC